MHGGHQLKPNQKRKEKEMEAIARNCVWGLVSLWSHLLLYRGRSGRPQKRQRDKPLRTLLFRSQGQTQSSLFASFVVNISLGVVRPEPVQCCHALHSPTVKLRRQSSTQMSLHIIIPRGRVGGGGGRQSGRKTGKRGG